MLSYLGVNDIPKGEELAIKHLDAFQVQLRVAVSNRQRETIAMAAAPLVQHGLAIQTNLEHRAVASSRNLSCCVTLAFRFTLAAAFSFLVCALLRLLPRKQPPRLHQHPQKRRGGKGKRSVRHPDRVVVL